MHHATYVAVMLTATVALAAEPAPYRPPANVPITGIGHRWDGKGVYPYDKPPTDFDEKSGKNIRWKTPLPNWGYGAPVPVGNRVLFLADSDARFIWPVLYCFDADTGQQVWSAEVNPLDAFPHLPAAERQRVTETVRKLWDDNRALFTAMVPLRALAGADADHPLLVEANRQLADRGLKVRRYARSYGILRYVDYPGGKNYKDPTLWAKYNIQPNLSNQGAGRTGDAFGTPVSDGVNAYVNTIHGTVAAYEMASGKRVWIRSIGGGQYREANHFMTSPRLYKDLVIACFGDTNSGVEDVVLALDRKTGEERWRHKVKGVSSLPPPGQGPGGSRPGSSPLIISIDGVDICLLGTGQVIRLPDGKMYAATTHPTLVPYAVDEKAQAIFAGTSTDRGSTRYRLDLSIKDGELQVKMGWVIAGNQRSYNTVFYDGRLYWGGYQLDPKTGWPPGMAPLEKGDPRGGYPNLKANVPETKQFLLIANGHVYGLDSEKLSRQKDGPAESVGVLSVYTVDGKPVSRNTLRSPPAPEHLVRQGFPDRNFSYSCPMNIGNDCIYIVSDQFLYCIGVTR